MSWAAIAVLAASAYALKAVGPLGLGGRALPPGVDRALPLLAVPLLAALVLDARAPALAVAGVLVWRRAPFLVVVLAAAGTAAGLRALA